MCLYTSSFNFLQNQTSTQRTQVQNDNEGLEMAGGGEYFPTDDVYQLPDGLIFKTSYGSDDCSFSASCWRW
jgi:hypothetical protein